MTKSELVNEISRKTGISKFEVIRAIESLMETIKANMTRNESIYLRGFGTFLVKKRAKKIARNISKNTTVIIPEHFIPIFKPSKEFIRGVKDKRR